MCVVILFHVRRRRVFFRCEGNAVETAVSCLDTFFVVESGRLLIGNPVLRKFGGIMQYSGGNFECILFVSCSFFFFFLSRCADLLKWRIIAR